jgi:hypothetical protein
MNIDIQIKGCGLLLVYSALYFALFYNWFFFSHKERRQAMHPSLFIGQGIKQRSIIK